MHDLEFNHMHMAPGEEVNEVAWSADVWSEVCAGWGQHPAPDAEWFQAAGYLMIGVGGLFFHQLLSPLIIIIAVLGIPSLIQRFRDANNPYYTSVPTGGRWAMGFAWLALVIYLGVASVQVTSLLGTFPR